MENVQSERESIHNRFAQHDAAEETAQFSGENEVRGRNKQRTESGRMLTESEENYCTSIIDHSTLGGGSKIHKSLILVSCRLLHSSEPFRVCMKCKPQPTVNRRGMVMIRLYRNKRNPASRIPLPLLLIGGPKQEWTRRCGGEVV